MEGPGTATRTCIKFHHLDCKTSARDVALFKSLAYGMLPLPVSLGPLAHIQNRAISPKYLEQACEKRLGWINVEVHLWSDFNVDGKTIPLEVVGLNSDLQVVHLLCT